MGRMGKGSRGWWRPVYPASREGYKPFRSTSLYNPFTRLITRTRLETNKNKTILRPIADPGILPRCLDDGF
jgi:hypothetical protein